MTIALRVIRTKEPRRPPDHAADHLLVTPYPPGIPAIPPARSTRSQSTAKLPLLMPVTRVAEPADAEALFAVAAEAIAGYREWAPSDWAPPVPSPADVSQLAGALARIDVWCLVALDAGQVIGYVALSPFTVEDREPPPAGTINLWQLFVRPEWQGQGVATELMDAAVGEARRRGFSRLRLWTPRGAARARRFYEREGWALTGRVHEDSPFGLPVLEYARSLDSPD